MSTTAGSHRFVCFAVTAINSPATMNIDAAVQLQVEKAAQAINDATALLFTAGAGMGVVYLTSEVLRDFGGPTHQWKN